jgi:hypothetical protein
MSIATFTTPLKGSPCTCIASGTNSINVNLLQKGVKKNESYLIRSILSSCKKSNIVGNMHEENYGVVNGSRHGRGVSM